MQMSIGSWSSKIHLLLSTETELLLKDRYMDKDWLFLSFSVCGVDQPTFNGVIVLRIYIYFWSTVYAVFMHLKKYLHDCSLSTL